jgi:hypothetical protein
MYTEFNASECHTTTWYETPVCLMTMTTAEWNRAHDGKTAAGNPKPETTRSTTPRPDYPAYLLRTFNGVLCETL